MLDTSFLIDLEKGNAKAVQAMESLAGRELLVPWHSVVEFLVGSADPVADLAALGQSYEIRMPSPAHLLEAARLRQASTERRRVHWGDIYIASECLVSGTFAVTANAADFKGLGCQIWDYRKGGTPPE